MAERPSSADDPPKSDMEPSHSPVRSGSSSSKEIQTETSFLQSTFPIQNAPMLVEENVIPVTDSTTATESGTPTHYGTESGHFETLNLTLSHEQGSERSERSSERCERTDERVT